MSDVKWIKIATDIFNNRKIKQIDRMPDGDSILVLWIKLLCLAGTINNDGILSLTQEVPYDVPMLAYEFRRHESVIENALATFERYGMIYKENGFYIVANWEKYQNAEKLEHIRELGRERTARHREKLRRENDVTLPSRYSNVTQNVTQALQPRYCNAIDKDIDKDKELDKELEEEKEEKEEKKDLTNYPKIIGMYNDTCVSFPRVNHLSDARKKAIKARLKKYSEADFQLLFEKAEASDFLKGQNNRNWSATFDWLIKDTNMGKVLDGNYDNRQQTWTQQPTNRLAQELEESYRMMAEWAAQDEGGTDQ